LPNIESAKKQQRVSLKRKAVNKAAISQTKTVLRKAEETIDSGDYQKAAEDVKAATSALDKAAGKGVIHAKNAARHKSRLEKRLSKAKESASSTK
jgi:small subunit ribosomal protein S20